MSLYLGIILGLIAMLGFGISKVYLKKLVQSAGVYSIAYTNSLMVLILFLVSIFAVKFQLPSFKLFCIIAALGFVGAFTFLLFMKSMNLGSVAVVVSVSSGFGVIIVVLAVLILIGFPYFRKLQEGAEATVHQSQRRQELLHKKESTY